MNDSELTPTSAPTPRKGISPALAVMTAVPFIGILLAVGLLIADQNTRNTPQSTSVPAVVGSVGQVIPDGVPLTDLDGEPVDFSQYIGRPIFVNFWGTWCPPCIRELPEMQAFAALQGDEGALVIAVNNTEAPDVIREFIADNDLALDDIIFLQDTESVFYRWFGVWQMPTTYLVDETGVVRAFKYGAFNNEAELQAYLDEMHARLQ